MSTYLQQTAHLEESDGRERHEVLRVAQVPLRHAVHLLS